MAASFARAVSVAAANLPTNLSHHWIATMEDPAAAHRHFSAACFNATWTLIEKPQRSPAEDELMVETAHASMYHWLCRGDMTEQNRSIGYWQLARVHALANEPDAALRYAQRCLATSEDAKLSPFFVAYAHEAMARASAVAGDSASMNHHLAQARALVAEVKDDHERDAVLADLATIGAGN